MMDTLTMSLSLLGVMTVVGVCLRLLEIAFDKLEETLENRYSRKVREEYEKVYRPQD